MKPNPETTPAPAGNLLVKRPEGLEGSWNRITIERIRAGQPRVYADSEYEALITFEGGTRSTMPNFDLPFAGKKSEQQVKEIAAYWVHSFKEFPNRYWYDAYLKTIEVVGEGPGWQQWRVLIIQPYDD